MTSLESQIPVSTFSALDRYVGSHIMPGGFLYAVLCNDLEKAVLSADQENREALSALVMYCYANIPAKCYGSPEKVNAWLDEKPEEDTVT